MKRVRTKPIDPFIQWLMDERGFKHLSEAAADVQINPNALTVYADRGVQNFKAMLRLARQFKVPIEKVPVYLSTYIETLNEADLTP